MPDRSRRQPTIVIVGGGVAGLALANALAVRGCASRVLEKTLAPGDVDRGDVLHQSTLEYFVRWNASDVLREFAPLEISRFRILNQDGHELLQFDLGRDMHPPARFTILAHGDIQRVLQVAALRTGRASVERGTVCTDLIVENGRVAGVQTNGGMIAADLTVLATGSFSKLRDRYFGKQLQYDYPVSFLNLRCVGLKAVPDSACYVLGPEGVMVIAPLPRGEVRIGLQLRRSRDEARMDRAAIQHAIRARLRTLDLEGMTITDAHVYRISKSLARSLSMPGAVLIGDAAHTTHPVGAQGMNMAFRDADRLAEGFMQVGFDADKLDAAAELYSGERRAQIKSILVRTHVIGLMACLEHPALIQLRALLLRAVNAATPAKRAVFQRVVEVR